MHLTIVGQGAAFVFLSQYSTAGKHQDANGCKKGIIGGFQFIHIHRGYWANIIFRFLRKHNVTIYFYKYKSGFTP
jgi:hypothetical protein